VPAPERARTDLNVSLTAELKSNHISDGGITGRRAGRAPFPRSSVPAPTSMFR
jgi:hypothetical protein